LHLVKWSICSICRALVMDGSGAIYVTDTRNFTIRKLTPMGTEWVVTTIAGPDGER